MRPATGSVDQELKALYPGMFGDAHYNSDHLVVSDEYEEELHPRDPHGKWTAGGGHYAGEHIREEARHRLLQWLSQQPPLRRSCQSRNARDYQTGSKVHQRGEPYSIFLYWGRAPIHIPSRKNN